MMDLLNKYFELEKQIHAHFGYVEQWQIFALDDAREYFWKLEEDKVSMICDTDAEDVLDAKKYFDVYKESSIYSEHIYTDCHLTKYVYRTDEYTMILLNSSTEGNILLSIFDNKKEVKPY